MRKLEAAFAVLIAVMALSFAWMFGDAKPNGKELLMGKFHLMMWLGYHFFYVIPLSFFNSLLFSLVFQK